MFCSLGTSHPCFSLTFCSLSCFHDLSHPLTPPSPHRGRQRRPDLAGLHIRRLPDHLGHEHGETSLRCRAVYSCGALSLLLFPTPLMVSLLTSTSPPSSHPIPISTYSYPHHTPPPGRPARGGLLCAVHAQGQWHFVIHHQRECFEWLCCAALLPSLFTTLLTYSPTHSRSLFF
jgi:hypothetical protein